MGDAGKGERRLKDWLTRQGRLRVFPEGDAPMVVRIGERRVIYTDAVDAEVILRKCWTDREIGELIAEMERDP